MLTPEEEKWIDYAHGIFEGLGIPAEYSAVSGMALLYQMQDKVPRDDKILIVSTGKAKFPS